MARWWRCRAVSSREGMAAPAALNTPSRPSRAYPELFALLGGQTPDLRGLFLRGHGGSSAALGVRQTQSLSEHTHGVGEVINGTGYYSGGYGAYRPWNWDGNFSSFGPKYLGPPISSGGEEVRPVNLAREFTCHSPYNSSN